MQTLATAEKSTSSSSVSLHKNKQQPFFAPVKVQPKLTLGEAKPPEKSWFQQMKTAPTTIASVEDLPPRNEIEWMGMQLQFSHDEFGYFLSTIMTDINNIRNYFKWVSGVYDRTYGHYDLVLKQANANADTQQQWVDFITGLVIGVGIGLLSEYLVAYEGSAFLYKLLIETGGELTEYVAGKSIDNNNIKPKIATAITDDNLNPALKKVQSLESLDRLNSYALEMAIPGPSIYDKPIKLAGLLSAELRVAEAKGQRKMSDLDIRLVYLNLMRFSLLDKAMQNMLKEHQALFNELRAKFMGKQAPSDQRCEQDIWIPWLAKQDPMGPWLGILDSIVLNKVIANHLVDIGLAERGKRGGRLFADVEYPYGRFSSNSDKDLPPAWQIVERSQAEATYLPAYWNDVFLMGND